MEIVAMVDNKEDIQKNIKTFYAYLFTSQDEAESKWAKKGLRMARNFYPLEKDGKILFFPSRFLGFKDNNQDLAEGDAKKEKRCPTERLNEVLGYKSEADEELELAYIDFLASLDLKPTKFKRKYWSKEL